MLRLKWKQVSGTQIRAPDAIDLTTNPNIVYLRKNISKIKNEENDRDVFLYDEAELTPAEFQEYLSIMESPALERINNDNLIIMEAIADLYERLENT